MDLLSALINLLLGHLSIFTAASPVHTHRSLNGSNNLTIPPTLKAPPNPFVFSYGDFHDVVFERKSTGQTKDNPSTTVFNVKHALQDAGRRILEMMQHSHVKGNAPFPFDKFVYDEPMARPSHHPHHVRRIRLEIRGINIILHLTYDAIKIIMLGLIEYTSLWDHGHAGSDRVGMCNFTMYWLPFGGQVIAEGSMSVVLPGPSTYIVTTS